MLSGAAAESAGAGPGMFPAYGPSAVPGRPTSPAPQSYQLKTMCLAKKSVQMPTKEEHGFLLFCGLGARRWQCDMDCNSLTFKQAILNIYPRLRSVIGYNLWTLTKNKKTFERIPEKVNTPKRMRSYLGPHFTGCLIIVPVSDIVLMEEKREHLRQIDIKTDIQQVKEVSGRVAGGADPDTNRQRSLCLICGKIEKTAGVGNFHKILEESLNCPDGSHIIARKLTDILGFNFEQSKRKFIASSEICKKCLRSVSDIVRLEEQVKRNKEELISNFFTTTSRYNKNQREGSHWEEARPQVQPAGPPDHRTGLVNSSFSPFLVQGMEQQVAFLNPATKQLPAAFSPAGMVRFYRPQYGGQDMQKVPGSHTSGSSGLPSRLSSPERRERSDYTGSEVGSSSFQSVSPSLQQQVVQQDQEEGAERGSRADSVSPRPFDTASFASTFSFASARSKEVSGPVNNRDKQNELTESRAMEKAENYCGDKLEAYSGGKPCHESEESSPRSEGSPRSVNSDSFESASPPNGASPGPAETEIAQERDDRRKHWKKRKRVQEREEELDTASSCGKSSKTEDSNESPDCQHQVDQVVDNNEN